MRPEFAIAAVTIALANRLRAAIGDTVPGAQATTLNPASEALRGGDPVLNIHLLRAAPSAMLRNGSPPIQGESNAPQIPELLLDLDYMLSFHGDGFQLLPDRLLGLAAAALHAEPVLSAADFQTHGFPTWLSGTVALLPGRAISIAPLVMPFETLAHYIGASGPTPYLLTSFYRVGPVALSVPPVYPPRPR